MLPFYKKLKICYLFGPLVILSSDGIARGNVTMLGQGSKAPDFTLSDQFGKNHSLSDFHSKWVVLYFYPKDMTPGCTTEACNFRDDFPNFQKLNTTILGISKDRVKRHAKFADKYKLPFLLLSDESGEVCEKYDVWKKSLYIERLLMR